MCGQSINVTCEIASGVYLFVVGIAGALFPPSASRKSCSTNAARMWRIKRDKLVNVYFPVAGNGDANGAESRRPNRRVQQWTSGVHCQAVERPRHEIAAGYIRVLLPALCERRVQYCLITCFLCRLIETAPDTRSKDMLVLKRWVHFRCARTARCTSGHGGSGDAEQRGIRWASAL